MGFGLIRFSLHSFFPLLLLIQTSCMDRLLIGELSINEPSGIARELEYIEIDIFMNQQPMLGDGIFIRSKKNGELLKGQILHSKSESDGSFVIRCLFPVYLDAQETKKYDILVSNDTDSHTDLKVEGEGLELVVENKYFIANLTPEKGTTENGLGSGQLTALTLKNFDKRKLRRSNINMHWAPNFQKKGLDYKTIGHILQFDSVFIDKGPYLITMYRSGKVDGYKEIQVEGKYQFYAGLPYFIFTSQMTMVDSVTLIMLRNDEMTMDSLFTHAMFPLPNGEVKIVKLYDDPPLTPYYSIKELRKTPIDANANWFCFYNDSLKYGFGSVRIQYDNTSLTGGEFPVLNPETRISFSGKGGRYWDRRFVFVKENGMKVPKGSRYAEKNAYVIFPVNPDNPSEKIAELFEQLTHPVIVTYIEL